MASTTFTKLTGYNTMSKLTPSVAPSHCKKRQVQLIHNIFGTNTVSFFSFLTKSKVSELVMRLIGQGV